ncbi:FAD-binding protein [Methylocapsa palsarum]|uniref:Glycolate oxidase FAD binding subunit n=1 Tax=Methylocapsa palsarum TaxID=1612308 RepID=A0A1I3VUV7_9HYPH|nr:FAD-binding protein [Methylocapsa palsarum]SFJ98929.1 glycolate oxidase FAD binding subunit [Methylocapsa palsarum]
MFVLNPADPTEVEAAVAEAAANRTPLAITGLASKASLGRPTNAIRLDLCALTGVTFYEPEELALSALAATPVATIEALLAEHHQELAFEPMSFGALYGTGSGTIGGCLMTNLSGPRRIKAGAARDHVLGIKAVSGRGEAFKAGGRVVKNVTGYDLSRGLAGSFGTLAVATEITFKVLPRAETLATLVLPGLESEAAAAALCAAMGAPVDVSGAAHLPLFAAARQGFPRAATLLRLEGFAPSVAARLDQLEAALRPFGRAERLDAAASTILWRAIRDAAPLAEHLDSLIWKISVAPKAGPLVAAAIGNELPVEAMFDWSGGLVWLALDPAHGSAGADAGAGIIRRAVASHGGGHATLMRAPIEIRAIVPVFEPQPDALRGLAARLKAQFDPLGILEPGRI